MNDLLVVNIGLLATPVGSAARGGKAQGEIRLLRDAWLRIEDGVIVDLGTGTPEGEGCPVLDAGGRLVTPGLVDAHTHLVFGGWRQNELALKLHGVPYLDILAQGGGILSTVTATRAATEEELADKAAAALDEMLRFGTTTCEAKSGYGLATDDLRRLDRKGWADYRVFPMAANVQMVFYRKSPADADPLVKLLLNENEATLPIKAAKGPYYRWSDVKGYLLGRIDELQGKGKAKHKPGAGKAE